MPPEVTGPIGALRAIRAAAGAAPLGFQCYRCTRIRRNTQAAILGTFLVLVTIILVLERLGLIK